MSYPLVPEPDVIADHFVRSLRAAQRKEDYYLRRGLKGLT
jgi:hypothetical protein